MSKGEIDLVVVAVLIVGGYVLLNTTNADGSPLFQLPSSIINIFVQNQTPPSNGGGATPPPVTNDRAPTSLTVVLNTYDCVMGSFVAGSVTSNGYNYPVTVYVKHVGSGEQISEGGLLAANGRFYAGSNIQTPGVYEVWASSSGVTSNKVTLSVHGCRVVCDLSVVPFSPGAHPVNVKIYGDKNSAVVAMVNDPAHAISYPFPVSVSTNAGGYVATSYDFAGKAKGNYEVDAIINGNKASSFSASWWVEVK